MIFSENIFGLLLSQLLGSVMLLALISHFSGVKELYPGTWIARPTWTAYFIPVVWLNIWVFAVCILSLPTFVKEEFYEQLNISRTNTRNTLLLVIVIYYAVDLYQAWNKLIQIDMEGVWKREGILPWTKVSDGLYWKDVERGWQIQGFLSWLLRSWTVEVKHRFLSDNRFVVKHMPSGTVLLINQRLQTFQGINSNNEGSYSNNSTG